MSDEIQKVLSALARVENLLGQLPDLCRELAGLSAKLVPVLQGQAEEMAKLDRQISEKQETDAFKLAEKLAALTTQVAHMQQKHDALQASEQSLKASMAVIKERVEQSVEAFKVPQAAG